MVLEFCCRRVNLCVCLDIAFVGYTAQYDGSGKRNEEANNIRPLSFEQKKKKTMSVYKIYNILVLYLLFALN